MARLVCDARAKLNLTLDVLRRREDGYHEIASVVHTVALSDTVSVRLVEGGAIRIINKGGISSPEGRENIAYKAAELFRSTLRSEGMETDQGIEIEIDKRIPTEAGLGGGSADAAAVLVLLNEAAGRPKDSKLLRDMAVKIGSDVPFMIEGGIALMESAGESLSPLAGAEDLDGLAVVIAKPQGGLSTSFMYGEWDKAAGRDKKLMHSSYSATRAFLRELEEKGAKCALRHCGNDFEAIAAMHLPDLAGIKREMAASGAIAAGMTGSGSAMYGIFNGKKDAYEAIERINNGFKGAFTALTTLDRRNCKETVCEVV